MKVIDIAFLKIKMILKDKGSLAWMFLAPVIFITVIVYGFNGANKNCNVSIIDNDKSNYSREYIELLEDNPEYTIKEKSYDDAREDLVNGEDVLMIEIPNNFSDMIKDKSDEEKIQIFKLRDSEKVRAIQNIIECNFQKLIVKDSIYDKSIEKFTMVNPSIDEGSKEEIKTNIEENYSKIINSSRLKVVEGSVIGDSSLEFNDMSYSTMGIMIIFIMFFVITGAGNIIEEKKNGTWDRIQTTGTSDIKIILGYNLGILITGFIQVAVLLIIGKYVYDVNWGKSPLGVILLFGAFLVSISSLGVLIGVICKTKKQLTSMTALIVMPTSLLAGCMWSRDMMPDYLLNISFVTPQSWVIDGMVNLVQRGSDLSLIFKPIISLCIFGIVFFLTTVLLERRVLTE